MKESFDHHTFKSKCNKAPKLSEKHTEPGTHGK